MDILHSKYKVIDKIGEGSFSEVLKCEHKESGVLYAAKRLKKNYKTEESIMTCAEIIAAQKLPYHPNILNMFEHFYDSFFGKVTFVFELMDMSLYDYLKSKHRGLSEQRSKYYLYQVLRGLEHLHRNGLFHRDVKPENILIRFPSLSRTALTKTNSNDVIKLADLGSVRGIYSAPPYTEYISTRWYRSPECLLTVGNYGSKMDVWATGCVFFEMITLKPLFAGTNEIDQLSKIHQVLGSPSIQFLSRLKTRSRNCVFFPKLKGTGIDFLLPFISRNGRNVLRLMVEYDAEKRINVKRLLRNGYFDDLRESDHVAEIAPQHNKKKLSKNESLKRSMADDGSLTANILIKPKILKREHYSDEVRKRSHHSNANDIPYYNMQPHSSGKVNIKQYTSMPLMEFKVLKSLGQNPTILKPSRVIRNKEKKLRDEELKAKSNTDTIKRDMDVKATLKEQFQSKSFVLPRRIGHTKADMNHEKLHKPVKEKHYLGIKYT